MSNLRDSVELKVAREKGKVEDVGIEKVMSDEQRAMSLEEAVEQIQKMGLWARVQGLDRIHGALSVKHIEVKKHDSPSYKNLIQTIGNFWISHDLGKWDVYVVVGQRSVFLIIASELISIIDATVNYYTLEQATSGEDNRVNVALFDLQDSGLITEISSKTCITAYSTPLLQENVLWSFEEESYEFMLNAPKYMDDKYTFTFEITDSGWQVSVKGSEKYQAVLTFPTLKEAVDKVIAIRKELYS